MASNKKINVPITHLSSNEIYALLDVNLPLEIRESMAH